MTIRVADARLLASTPGSRVALLGDPDGWDEALRAVGTEVGADNPELVVAARDCGAEAAATGAESVILLGGATREPVTGSGGVPA